MKVIEKYQANDGKVFGTREECVKYDLLLNQIEGIMKRLNPLPKDEHCNFANGKGYIQQDRNTVELVRGYIYVLAHTTLNLKKDVSWGWLGRYLDDSGITCLYSAWGRIECIDKQGREWGQPYYAINPHEGTQKPYVE